jgi:hypothetical protein
VRPGGQRKKKKREQKICGIVEKQGETLITHRGAEVKKETIK